MTTLPHVLLEQAASHPNALALQDGEMSLSYKELSAVVSQAAGVMEAGGLSKGERFAIWAPNCAEWVIVALAGQMIGGVLVTLNTRYKGHEAADILKRSKCKFLFTVRGFLKQDFDAALEGLDLPDLQAIEILKNGDSGAPFVEYLARGGKAVCPARRPYFKHS